MSLTVVGTKTALRPGLTASFGASGGTGPYAFSVAVTPQAAGGTVDPASGLYAAPSSVPPDARQFYDAIVATDSLGVTGQATVLIAHSWMLMPDVFRVEMGIPLERSYFWNVKETMPVDDTLFLVFALSRQKPLASNIQPVGTPVGRGGPGWDSSMSWTQIAATLDIHIYSRGLDALSRLPEVFMALVSPYCREQQVANGFYLAKLPTNAADISGVDGTAIPYHYVVSMETLYTVRKVYSPPYYSSFQVPPGILVEAG